MPWQCPRCGVIFDRPGQPHEPCWVKALLQLWIPSGSAGEVLDLLIREGIEIAPLNGSCRAPGPA